jgi:hypothetical protein
MNQGQAPRRKLIAIIVAGVLLLMLVGIIVYSASRSHSKHQSLLEKQQSEFAKTATADPILKDLPYGSLDYNITPTFQSIKGKRTLVLVVSVILTDADYKQSPQAIQTTITQKEQSSVDYIRSKGFDPSKYTIQYDVPAH